MGLARPVSRPAFGHPAEGLPLTVAPTQPVVHATQDLNPWTGRLGGRKRHKEHEANHAAAAIAALWLGRHGRGHRYGVGAHVRIDHGFRGDPLLLAGTQAANG
jgi:hypothetical protein